MDWQEQLSNILSEFKDSNVQDTNSDATNDSVTVGLFNDKKQKKQVIRVEAEKRRGKIATILSAQDGGEIEDSQDLARILKQRIATGGSERDGEILLQGDVRNKVASVLEELGYKLKKINF